MLKCREACSRPGLTFEVKLARNVALTTGQTTQNCAPEVHNHAVTIGFTSIRVKAGLCRSNDVAKILDGPGTQ